MQVMINAEVDSVKDIKKNYGNIESSYAYNNFHFTKDDEPIFPIAGEFPFNRISQKNWEKELLKMKTSGINMISIPIIWNYHEVGNGEYNFENDNDIKLLIKSCKYYHLRCILKLGPYFTDDIPFNGLPKRIFITKDKKKHGTDYLKELSIFWKSVYDEISEFLDGETIAAIDFNAHKSDNENLLMLKKLAIKIGFKAPFFTVKASDDLPPSDEFLPMHYNTLSQEKKNFLKPNNNFCIMPNRVQGCIGDDLIVGKKEKLARYTDIPYACGEVSTGMLPSVNTRALITELDGYGIAFSRFASGCNFMGYKMYHGGRNDIKRINNDTFSSMKSINYPVVDCDYQAPISRYGEGRRHGDLLRLLHMFTESFDENFSQKRTFFPHWLQKSFKDTSYPKCSVRVDENLSGYFFVSSYERGLEHEDHNNVEITISNKNKVVELPTIDIKKDSMYFFPFNFYVDGRHFDYVLAQPIAQIKRSRETIMYFKKCNGLKPIFSSNGFTHEIPFDSDGYLISNVNERIRLIVLSDDLAKKFYLINDKVYFGKGTVYSSNKYVYCETTDGELKCENQRFISRKIDVSFMLDLVEIQNVNFPLEKFLNSKGKNKYYELKVDKEFFEKLEDARVEFDFTGLNLQVYCGQTLINDYFNTDSKFVMYLDEFKDHIMGNRKIVIVTTPATKSAIKNINNEINLKHSTNNLKLKSCLAVYTLRVKL